MKQTHLAPLLAATFLLASVLPASEARAADSECRELFSIRDDRPALETLRSALRLCGARVDVKSVSGGWVTRASTAARTRELEAHVRTILDSLRGKLPSLRAQEACPHPLRILGLQPNQRETTICPDSELPELQQLSEIAARYGGAKPN
ncbi:MAG: hypothetical protein NDJ89_06655 [Oligoflexia bacterium]|nr:hypothetical protein [Oligoflexia bacterium]